MKNRLWLALIAPLALGACWEVDGNDNDLNSKPSWLGSVSTASYDGGSDDLLTAGLGKDGLAGAAPGYANAASPTAAEIRKNTIYVNYRALVDMTTNGGYGRLWGPNIDLEGNDTLGAGKIAGTESLAFADDGNGAQNVTVMVQIPASFSKANPCIVTATSSGSRGVYGAVSAAGEWGLKRGCAVAYTDKGSGNGAHELGSNTVTLINGLTANATTAGKDSLFTADITSAQRSAFNTTWPNRYAYKHAHSQQNPEKDWGKSTLRAIEFALYQLNELKGDRNSDNKALRTFTAANTTVIASSVSNGGGAALAAAEQDTSGLIDAVVVGEPQVYVNLPAGVSIARNGVTVPSAGRPLYDYVTVANLMQPCAAWAAAASGSPFQASVTQADAQARCAALVAGGYISGGSFAAQSAAALAALHAAGWESESDLLHASHFALSATQAVAVTYANAYSRSSVLDNLCDYSFATVDSNGRPAAPAASPMPTIFASGNGVPPSSTVNLVLNSATGGPIRHYLANGDFGYVGADCLRTLWTGNSALAQRVKAGVAEIRLTGNLHGKPALIVQGRSDALVPVNHASRAYLAANKSVEGASSKLSYIEVTNGQHFDGFLGLAGFDTRFIPVHYYNLQALNLMWAKLKSNAALPVSQVVRATPRGGSDGAAPALTTANLPAISSSVDAGNLISFSNNRLNVPN
ncbi:3-hydroxybutyrate oligomer hydrolase family protein [Derxia gummosa]|uniref:3-hydroxybutyrate oligomer hydrolase family protein n=1 Tax=Derxia gummosa DSM 723 TaxID=1121388 RepID=A0A8B6X1S1_9BURK|nr:3-hydroxybutyrate oligomer hydrolase family protein [Derxia gummosa]